MCEVKEIKGVGAKSYFCTSRSRARRLTQRSREMTGPESSYSVTTDMNMSEMTWCPVGLGWMQVKSNQFSASAPR